MEKIIVILDPAHGSNVPGKRSPDGSHFEYKWSRERLHNLRDKLIAKGFTVFFTTESEIEPGLTHRRNFASVVEKGKQKLLISLHNNAAGNGSSWCNATGVEVWTTKGITKSDICADIFLRVFKEDFNFPLRINKNTYLERDKEENWSVLVGSGYMGVLIEWLFQDNKKDVESLKSPEINASLEDSLVKAVEEINNHFTKNGKTE